MRNKQLQQLHKHLAKNAERKTLNYGGSRTKLNVSATSIVSNDNADSANKINHQGSLQSDSGISDDDRKYLHFSNTSKTSTKKIKKGKSLDKIVDSISYTYSQNKNNKPETTISKHNINSNTDHSSNDDNEENTKSTQQLHNLINSDEGNRIYTQYIEDSKNSGEKMLKKKDFKDYKNKIMKERSKSILSMISDSKSNSKDKKLSIKKKYQINLNKEIGNNTMDISLKSKDDTINIQNKNSSGDEIYTKRIQNISKSKHTTPLTEQTKGQTFQEIISEDVNNSLLDSKKKKKQINTNSILEVSKCTNNKNKLPNIFIENDKRHILEENCSSNDEENVFLNKDVLKKPKQTNEKLSTLESSMCNKNEIILQQNLGDSSSSDDEVNVLLNKEMSKKSAQINEKSSTSKSSTYSKSDIIQQQNVEEDSSSSDDEVNVLLNKEMSKKSAQVNKKSTDLESSIYSKNEIIQQPNLEDSSNSDDEVNVLLNKEISKKSAQINEKSSTSKSSTYSKSDIIQQQNVEDSSSSDKVNTLLTKEISKTEKAQHLNKTLSILESSKCNNKKIKEIPIYIDEKNIKKEIFKHNTTDTSSSTDNEINVLLNKDVSKKPKQINEKSYNLKSLTCRKNEIFQQKNLENNSSSSSDDDVNILLNREMLKKLKQINEKSATLESSMYSNEKKKLTPNLISKNNKKNEIIKHILEDFSTNNELKIENIKKDNNLSLKKSLKKENKRKHEGKTSIVIQPTGSDNKNKLSTNVIDKNINKNEIIKYILNKDLSSDDDVKYPSLKIKNTDEYKLKNQKVSNKKPTEVLNINKNTPTELKKKISNPFIKLYTQNSTSSSSENEEIINLIKSKDILNRSSKKNSTLKNKNKKEDIIKKVLTSIKHQNKKLLVKPTNLNYSDGNKHNKSKLKKNKSLDVTKNKKAILVELETPINELKPNKLTTNVYLKDSQLQQKVNPTNDSTDDEIDIIKKILEKKQKLKKINNKKTELPKSIVKTNISTKSNNLKDISEKLDKKLKFQKASTSVTNELINNIKIKNKMPKEIKDLSLDNIINSKKDSPNSHIKAKKKKKNHTTDVYEDKNVYEDLSKVKKRKKHNEDINLNNLIVQDIKNKFNDSSFKFEQQNILARENTFTDITKQKKEKKVKRLKIDPIQCFSK